MTLKFLFRFIFLSNLALVITYLYLTDSFFLQLIFFYILYAPFILIKMTQIKLVINAVFYIGATGYFLTDLFIYPEQAYFALIILITYFIGLILSRKLVLIN